MKVTSQVSIDFPKLKWAVNAGNARELPANKEAAALILAHPDIRQIVEPKKAKKTN